MRFNYKKIPGLFIRAALLSPYIFSFCGLSILDLEVRELI